MNFLRSPRNKLLAATLAVLILALLAPIQGGASASQVARVLLGAAAAAGLIYWFARQKKGAFSLEAAPRLRVLARTGLSQRCGMALVEADGDNYLVVFGDGFAELQQAKLARPTRVQGRRPRPVRRVTRGRVSKGGAR